MKLRVDYIKRPYKDKTYVYPFLVSSYRDENGVSRNKVIQNLSHLPEYVVEAIRIALRSEGEVKSVPVDTIKYLDSLPFGDTWAVWTIMKQIGIIDALEKLPDNHIIPIIASIVDRVINPKPYSKRALWDSFESSALKKILQATDRIPLQHWYNALDSLHDCQMDIQKQLYNGHTNRVYLYDITSSYFEGTCCPLADWGYNRDGKKGKMIIVIGLLTTEEGRPIAVKVFPGNTNDQTTVIDQLKELKTEFGVQEIIFVGDRGMITSKRITEIESEDLNWVKYITALKRQDMMRMVEDNHHPIQLGLFDHQNLVELDHEGKRYILCHNPLRKDEDTATRLRLLDKTEEKLRSIANNVKNGRLKDKDRIARRLYRWINKWNMERFFNVEYKDGYFSFCRNQEEIERYAILDGCYVIISNVTVAELSTSSVHSKYKDLKYVENAFRCMKVSDIFLRPIRHWTATRVQGHVFMCMLAYLVVWEAKKRLSPLLERNQHNRECDGNSLREIWDALKMISIGRLSIAGIESKQVGEITKDQKKILHSLRTPFAKRDKARLSLLI